MGAGGAHDPSPPGSTPGSATAVRPSIDELDADMLWKTAGGPHPSQRVSSSPKAPIGLGRSNDVEGGAARPNKGY